MALTLQLVVAILATYRLSQLFPFEDGPFYVFKRFRNFTIQKMDNEEDELGKWHNLYDWTICPYCQGLYAALLCGLLVSFPTIYGNIFLIIFAIAGGQSILQKYTE